MEDVKKFIHTLVANTLETSIEQVDADEEFMSLGLDSMHAIFLIDEIEKAYDTEINPHAFWEYPTINSFATYLESKLTATP